MGKAPTALNIRALKPAAIEAMLRTRHPGARVAAVQLIDHARCGDGIASTADRQTLSVHCTLNDGVSLPERMVLKTRTLRPWMRMSLPSILALSSVSQAAEGLPLIGRPARKLLFVFVGAFQKLFPQAPDAMYLTEVRFYADLRSGLDIEAPVTYGSLFDERSRQFGVLLEDLNLRAVRFPNALEELPLSTVKSLLETLAHLHAHFWESARFGDDLAWVPTRLAGGMFPVFDGIGRELISYQVQSNAFKLRLLRPLGRTVDELWRGLWQSQEILAGGPQTLLHGDTHTGNTYQLPDGRGGLLDWQLMVRGNPMNDVSYLLCTSLPTETRRAEERDLIAFYLSALARLGISSPPSLDEAWRDHRLAAIWGLVIGWLITPPVNYGEAITSANIRRMVAACNDLDAFELTGALAERETVRLP
jgi:hypothetical protein